MQKHRTMTLVTGALAACVALCAVMITPQGSSVQASTIFASLRDSLVDGFELRFENIGDEEVTLNGRMLIEFEPLAPEAEKVHVRAFYADGTLQTTAAATDFPNMTLDYALSLNEADPWAYVRLVGDPPAEIEEQPWLWTVWGMLDDGVLLGLAGMWDGFEEEFANEFGGDVALSAPAGDKPVTISELEFSTTDQSATSDTPSVKARSNVTMRVGEADPAATDEIQVRTSSRVSITPDIDIKEFDSALLEDVLYGRATREDIGELVGLLEEAAQTVTVTEVAPGAYQLVAADFVVEDADEPWLAEMVLRVDYRIGQGLTRAVLTNFTRPGGSLEVLTLADGVIDPSLQNKDHWMVDGTQYWDLGALEQMFGG